MRSSGLNSVAVAALLALFIIVEAHSALSLSPTFDEPYHYLYGLQALTELRTTRKDPLSINNSKMPVSALNAAPEALLGSCQSPFQDDPTLWLLRRSPTILFGALLGLSVFAWARELFGLAAGFLALALFLFNPTVLAHSNLVTTDAACACMMFLSLFSAWRYLKGPSWRRFLSFSLLTGLAQLTKYTALWLFPIHLLIFATARFALPGVDLGSANSPRPRRPSWEVLKQAPTKIAVFALVNLLIINAGFLFEGTFSQLRDYSFRAPLFIKLQQLAPWLPVPVPYPYLQGIDLVMRDDSSGHGWGLYLLGKFSDRGWWYYYVVAFLLKEPLSLILLLISAATATLLDLRKDRTAGLNLIFCSIPSLLLFGYFSLFSRTQIGIRYLLPLYPLMFVFAGRLATFRPKAKALRLALLASILAWYIASALSYHPHYLAYFNELIGDRKNAYKFLVDSNLDWGQSRRAVQAFIAGRRFLTVKTQVPVEPLYVSPSEKLVLISANTLTIFDRQGRYRWLRTYEPISHVAYAWLVFKVSGQDMDRLLLASSRGAR